MPLTLWFGVRVLGDRQYYLISVLLLLYTMVPFALVFERRRPQARELMLIAVLTALAVAGRGAFFMVPNFKPVAAIVILAGVGLGPESGFLVGALSGFVSNFFFGQGPWTPFQMFCFGMIGFLAGLLCRAGYPKKPLALTIYGGVATFFLYGGIMDLVSVLTIYGTLTKKTVLAAYAAGVSFNLIHAAASVVFLLVLTGPILTKLDRVKKKYGLME
ncbi:ECF transporter S component [Clostridiales bacterium BX7]|uniref:ECF transporter S component n=2 Tax=Feifania hominis TaxID=2763660 RepID=A0A926DEE7_9FIRM|nr:ECF transporter S component [Feifania hominis]MBC8535799.1 ECF transporter S component [Feifania hominis]